MAQSITPSGGAQQRVKPEILIATRVEVPAADDCLDGIWLVGSDGSCLNRFSGMAGAPGVEIVGIGAIGWSWPSDTLFMPFLPVGAPPARVSKSAIRTGRIPVEMRWVGLDMDLPARNWDGVDFEAFCRRHLGGPMARRFAWWQTRGGLRGLAQARTPVVLQNGEQLELWEARLRAHRLQLQAETGLEFDPAACDDATRLQRVAHGTREDGLQRLAWHSRCIGSVELLEIDPRYKPGESPEERAEARRHREARAAAIRARGIPVDRAERAMRYVEACGDAVKGQDGHIKARAVLWRTILGFALDETEAVEIGHAYNRLKCDPPYEHKAIEQMARDAWRKTAGDARRGDMLYDGGAPGKRRLPSWVPPLDEAEAAEQTLIAQEILDEFGPGRHAPAVHEEVPRETSQPAEPGDAGSGDIWPDDRVPGEVDYRNGDPSFREPEGRDDAGGGDPLEAESDPEESSETAWHQEFETVRDFDSILTVRVEKRDRDCTDRIDWDVPLSTCRECYERMGRTASIPLRNMAAGLRSCQAGIDHPKVHHLESAFGVNRWRCRHSKYCPLCAWVQAHSVGDSALRTIAAAGAEPSEKRVGIWALDFTESTLLLARHHATLALGSYLKSSRVDFEDAQLLKIWSRRDSAPAGIIDADAHQIMLVVCFNPHAIKAVHDALRDLEDSGGCRILEARRATAGYIRCALISALHVPDWFASDAATAASWEEYFNAEAGEPAFQKTAGLGSVWVEAEPRPPEGEPERGQFKSVLHAREVIELAQRDKQTASAVVRTKIREYVRYDAGCQPHAPVVRYRFDEAWTIWKRKTPAQRQADRVPPPDAPQELSGWRAWEMLLELQSLLQSDRIDMLDVRPLFDSIRLRSGPTRRQPGGEGHLPRILKIAMREQRKEWDAAEAASVERLKQSLPIGQYAQRTLQFA